MKLVSFAHANWDLRVLSRELAAAKENAGERGNTTAGRNGHGKGKEGREGKEGGGDAGADGKGLGKGKEKEARELQEAALAAEDAYAVLYPRNLTLGNMAYFALAPTLCYQPSYPRSGRFRLRWLLRRVFELALFGGLQLFIVEQYMLPAVSNTVKPFDVRSRAEWPGDAAFSKREKVRVFCSKGCLRCPRVLRCSVLRATPHR